MSGVCPCCHGTGRAPDLVAELRAWCLARGLEVLPGDRVCTATAARILGVSVGHLGNDRAYYQRIPFERTDTGRVRYELSHLVMASRGREGR